MDFFDGPVSGSLTDVNDDKEGALVSDDKEGAPVSDIVCFPIIGAPANDALLLDGSDVNFALSLFFLVVLAGPPKITAAENAF